MAEKRKGTKHSSLDWAKSRLGRWPLFASIAFWVVLASIAFVVICRWLFGKCLWQINFTISATPLDIVRVALTMLGGIGAVGYLVIKYQERQAKKREERRDIEKAKREDEQMGFVREDRVKTSFSEGIRMLGDDKPSTRIAGVYTLVELADVQRDTYPQRVIDILCGYLRTKRDNDGPVETTILHAFHDHLQNHLDEQYWGQMTIDLRSAVLTEEINFQGISVHSFRADDATFRDRVSFDEAHLGSEASFQNAKFMKRASFARAHFDDRAIFSKTEFFDSAFFGAVQFGTSTLFTKCIFSGRTSFSNATFRGAGKFTDTQFKRTSLFLNTKFGRQTSFDRAVFDEYAIFVGASFIGATSFKDTTYAKTPLFARTVHNKKAVNEKFFHSQTIPEIS